MSESGPTPDRSHEPYHPEFRDPRSAWRWRGFLLIVLGTAGLLFHRVWSISVTATWEGKTALGAVMLGILFVIVGFLRRRDG